MKFYLLYFIFEKKTPKYNKYIQLKKKPKKGNFLDLTVGHF